MFAVLKTVHWLGGDIYYPYGETDEDKVPCAMARYSVICVEPDAAWGADFESPKRAVLVYELEPFIGLATAIACLLAGTKSSKSPLVIAQNCI